jgi:hypothetical protein
MKQGTTKQVKYNKRNCEHTLKIIPPVLPFWWKIQLSPQSKNYIASCTSTYYVLSLRYFRMINIYQAVEEELHWQRLHMHHWKKVKESSIISPLEPKNRILLFHAHLHVMYKCICNVLPLCNVWSKSSGSGVALTRCDRQTHWLLYTPNFVCRGYTHVVQGLPNSLQQGQMSTLHCDLCICN